MFNFILHVVTLIAMSVPTVIAYNLVFGKGKILHFGQLAFSIVGGYTLWILVVRYHFPFVGAFCLAIIVVSITSLLFAWLSLRLDEDAFGVMSIAVHLMFLAVILNWQSVTRGALGVPGIPRPITGNSPIGFAVLSIIIAALCVICISKLSSGSFGRAVSALSEHKWHAQSLGIERSRIHIVLFFVAGIGALLANFLFHSYLHLITPMDFQFPIMIYYVMVVVAGGPGSLMGSVVSVSLMVVLRESLRFLRIPISLTGPLELILFGVILFIAVYIRRDTLFPKQRSI